MAWSGSAMEEGSTAAANSGGTSHRRCAGGAAILVPMRRTPVLACLLALLATTACGSTVQQAGPGSAGLPGSGLAGDGLSAPGADDPPAAAADGEVAGGPEAPGAAPGTGPAAAGPAPVGAPAQGSVAGAPGGGATAPVAAGSIPETGRGWDAKNVYIGVATQKDVQQAFETVGVSGLNAGDQEGQALAMAAELNRRGGLFGRKVQIVFRDHATIATASDPNTTAQATCTFFTQDRPVVAFLNPVTLMDGSALRSCFAKARVPLFSASVAALDNRALQTYAPYMIASVAPAWDPHIAVLVTRLKAQGYFGGWDAAAGAAVPGTAKIGILIKNDDISGRIVALIRKAVEGAGATDVQVYAFKDGSEMSSAVLQFRGRGVTHVVSTDGGALLGFMLSAEDQGYRPRYALSSFLTPAALLEGTAPQRQLVGAVGAGWSPSIDVSDARDPGDTGPGETECKKALAQGGQTFEGKRLAEAVAFAFCDGLRLIAASAKAGGGLSGPQIAQGMQTAGPRLASAFGFGNGFGPGRYFLPGAVRDLAYDAGCRCFAYTSRTSHRM